MEPEPVRHQCPVCLISHLDKEGRDKLCEHSTTCLHCKEPVYYEFVVIPEVWTAAGLGYHDGVIHLPCLEKLLKRSLEVIDFAGPFGSRKHSINDAILWAMRR